MDLHTCSLLSVMPWAHEAPHARNLISTKAVCRTSIEESRQSQVVTYGEGLLSMWLF
jgi:hypothetical protein